MILLTCSAGGHLTEMRQLSSFYHHYDHAFVTFERADTQSLSETEKVYFIPRPGRNMVKTVRAFFSAWRIVSKTNPELVISTGADVTVPVCLAAKLQGKRVIFIESFCRPYTPSWSGRIISLFADKTIYQWKSLKSHYPNGIYGGSIFVSK